MTKLQDYEYNGYEGVDIDLEISLFEYGIVGKVDDEEMKVVFGIAIDDEGNYTRFDYGSITKDDVKEILEWDKEGFLSFVGMTEDEWLNGFSICQVYDLINYWGIENVMGSSYWEGFEIEK